MSYDWLARLPMFWVEEIAGKQVLKPSIGFFWAWPVATIITVACESIAF